MPGKKQIEEKEPKVQGDMTYFEADMKGFFERGGMPRLQRWFTGKERQECEILAAMMVTRFANKLAELLPNE